MRDRQLLKANWVFRDWHKAGHITERAWDAMTSGQLLSSAAPRILVCSSGHSGKVLFACWLRACIHPKLLNAGKLTVGYHYKQEKLKSNQPPHRESQSAGDKGGKPGWGNSVSPCSVLCRSVVTDSRRRIAVYELLAEADVQLRAHTAQFLLVRFCFPLWSLETFYWSM